MPSSCPPGCARPFAKERWRRDSRRRLRRPAFPHRSPRSSPNRASPSRRRRGRRQASQPRSRFAASADVGDTEGAGQASGRHGRTLPPDGQEGRPASKMKNHFGGVLESGPRRPVERHVTKTTAACAALGLLAALPCAAFASPEPQLDLMRRGYAPGYPWRSAPDARQGLLLSFGLGGGSLCLSDRGPARVGAADVDFRIVYGFSDRFQMFMDLNADGGSTYSGDSVGSWTWTVRAQTLLVGDRAGNGL